MPGLTTATPYAWLGVAALAIVALNALLVAAHAAAEARRHLASRRALGTVQVGVARGELAAHEVEQVGRALDGGEMAIAFTDRVFRSEVIGGVVDIDGRAVRVVGAAGALVWPLVARQREAAALPDDATFEATHAKARGPRGATVVVRTTVRAGDQVWLAGEREGDELRATVVALRDPRAFHASAAARELALAVVELAVFAALAALALWPPAFGTVSTVGGVLLLAYFLLVQPAGVWVEDALRPPPVAFLRGEWRRRANAPASPSPTPLS